MAARFDSLVSRQHSGRGLAPVADAHVLSRHERVARIQRRRRLSAAAAAVESALWVAGAAVVVAICIAGLTGLH